LDQGLQILQSKVTIMMMLYMSVLSRWGTSLAPR